MQSCRECGQVCSSLLSIITHLRRSHNISYEKYLIKYFFNNKHPLCICGCGQEVKYFRGKFRKFLQGHVLRDYYYLGTKDVQEKRKQTNLRRYNGISPACSKNVRDKITQTNLKKYGGSSPGASESVRQKINNTNLKRYGVKSPLQNYKIMQKLQQTNLQKYGVDNPSKNETIKEKLSSINRFSFDQVCAIVDEKKYDILFKEKYYKNCRCLLPFRCQQHDKIFFTSIFNIQNRTHQCPLCKRQGISEIEKDIVRYLKLNTDLQIIENSREIIAPKEIDIYIPEKRIAIELHGLYWHSEKFKNKDLHYSKFKLCESKNIKLIQLFSNEWVNKKNICKSILLRSIGIDLKKYAINECVIRKNIPDDDMSLFLNNNHIFGTIFNQKSFGIYHEDKLVYLITLDDANDLKITRVCVENNCLVIDGFFHLMNYILKWAKKNKKKHVLINSDCRFHNGKIYKNYGFNFVKHTGLNYYYTDGTNYYDKIINPNVCKIYDAGNYLWEYNI